MLRACTAGEIRASTFRSSLSLIYDTSVYYNTWKCRDKPKSVDYGRRTRRLRNACDGFSFVT